MPDTTTKRKSKRPAPDSVPRKPRRHCNGLDGKRWIQNSISVWSDLSKSIEERQLKHPAMFPSMLAARLIETFLPPEANTVLDPFCGSGSTLLAAEALGQRGIGIELSPEYATLTRDRLAALEVENSEEEAPQSIVHQASATELLSFVEPESVDLCISSPPYWNILNQRRTADFKDVRHYGNLEDDLGIIEDYEQFLDAATSVFADVFTTLKPGAYCCPIVMDLRRKNRFFPLHSDLATRLAEVGYVYDDLIIWNRQAEYNNLRPLGYPSVFRVNKVHEFVLIMQKPK
jgi:DNA modification methylase